MKASELRIGNWYNHNGIFRQVTPNTIEEVWEAERTWCKPIPLTEEWLVKMGFTNDEFISYRWYKEWNGVVIMAYDLDDNCVKVSDDWEFPPRHYVHQLQNLYYALTNEELTLNK